MVPLERQTVDHGLSGQPDRLARRPGHRRFLHIPPRAARRRKRPVPEPERPVELARNLPAARLRKRARRRIRAGLGRFGSKHFFRIQRTLQRIQHERDVWAELQYAERVRSARGRIPVRMEFPGAVEPRLRTRSGTGVRHRMERIHRRTMAARTRMGRLPVLVRRSVRFESQPRYRTEQKLGRQRRCLLPTVGRQRPKIQGDDSARKGFGAPNDQNRQSRRMGRRGSLLRIVQRQHDAPGSLRLLRPLLHEQHRP